VVIAAILVGVGYGTHWYGLAPASKSSPPGACPTGDTISGAGANFLAALMSQWETSFNTASSNTVSYNPDGAGAGIQLFNESEVNFAATDQPLTSGQYSSLPGTTLTLPVTGGALAIVYNLPGWSGPLKLTGAQLAGIYLGTITNWDDSSLATLNSGLPNHQIIPVVRSDSAGTSYVLTNYLSDDSSTFQSTVGISIMPNWPSLGSGLPVAEKGNSGLATYVASTAGQYSIGYVDLADAHSHNSGQIAAMGNPSSDYILPNVTNTQSAINYLAAHQTIPASDVNWVGVTFVNSPQAGDYPLSTLSYFLVLKNPGLAGKTAPSLSYTQVIVEFLKWVVNSGQSYADNLYYVQVPQALLNQDLGAIQTMNFNGTSIPDCTI
jgi:phosphate transport system substrate-binding protein